MTAPHPANDVERFLFAYAELAAASRLFVLTADTLDAEVDCYFDIGEVPAPFDGWLEELDRRRDADPPPEPVHWPADGIGTLIWVYTRLDAAIRLFCQTTNALGFEVDVFVDVGTLSPRLVGMLDAIDRQMDDGLNPN